MTRIVTVRTKLEAFTKQFGDGGPIAVTAVIENCKVTNVSVSRGGVSVELDTEVPASCLRELSDTLSRVAGEIEQEIKKHRGIEVNHG